MKIYTLLGTVFLCLVCAAACRTQSPLSDSPLRGTKGLSVDEANVLRHLCRDYVAWLNAPVESATDLFNGTVLNTGEQMRKV